MKIHRLLSPVLYTLLTALLLCVAPQARAQQNVFSRDNSGTNLWWASENPWYYQTDNNNQNRPDNPGGTTRNDVFIGHNEYLTMNVNEAFFQLRTLTIQSTASSNRTFSKSGSNPGISLSVGFTNESAGSQTFNVPIGVDGGTVNFSSTSTGTTTFTDSFFLNANTAAFGGTGNFNVTGTMSGSGGGFTKSGSGTLSVSGSNTFTGGVTVSGGTLKVGSSNALGTTAGSTTVESGATLELSGGTALAENITITGSGVGGSGAIRSSGNGQNALTGTITLGGNARIQAAQTALTTLAVLGTNNFEIIPEFGNIPLSAYSQTATNWTMNYTVNFGDNNIASGSLGGDSGLNLGGFTNYGILMSLTGTNNNLPFSVEFFDGDSEVANLYTGTMTGIGGSLMLNPLTLDTPGMGNMTNIIGMTFTWNGSGAVNTTLASVVGIPTSALAISGNITGGANVLTLGAEGAGAGTVGGSILVSGAISGAGGSYGGTTTSLVKDGAGTVTLSGNNTFTGDTRIEAGTLVATGTNALGAGSDVIITAGASLNVRTNVSVGSVQGTSSSSGGTVVLTNNALLTVSGADRGDVYQPGAISGQGRLTLAGSNTTLHLSGNNTFTGATRVEAGTLAVEATGGNQALRSTASVTVLSGAKLLVGTSNQVNDSATVTLSGGTIAKGAGAISETFGALTLTATSFLDFGSGTGSFTFSTYNPSTYQLTFQNFNLGNSLTVTTGSFSASQFNFSGFGYTWAAVPSGGFTITAIPEPSTVAAALGLLGLMLWSQRRAVRGVLKADA